MTFLHYKNIATNVDGQLFKPVHPQRWVLFAGLTALGALLTFFGLETQSQADQFNWGFFWLSMMAVYLCWRLADAARPDLFRLCLNERVITVRFRSPKETSDGPIAFTVNHDELETVQLIRQRRVGLDGEVKVRHLLEIQLKEQPEKLIEQLRLQQDELKVFRFPVWLADERHLRVDVEDLNPDWEALEHSLRHNYLLLPAKRETITV